MKKKPRKSNSKPSKKASRKAPKKAPIPSFLVRTLVDEGRCFNETHKRAVRSLTELTKKLEEGDQQFAILSGKLKFLEDELLKRPDETAVKELETAANLKGFQDGVEHQERKLRESKTCFRPSHSFFEGKHLLSLDPWDAFSVLVQMKGQSMGAFKVQIMVPDGIDPKKPISDDPKEVANKLIQSLL